MPRTFGIQGFKVQNIVLHRNGIAGRPFHAVYFEFDNGGQPQKRMMAILPREAKHKEGDQECFVVDLDNPEANYRGDNFIQLVRNAVIKHTNDEDNEFQRRLESRRKT